MDIAIIVMVVLYLVCCIIVAVEVKKGYFKKVCLLFVALTVLAMFLSLYNNEFKYLFLGQVMGFCPLFSKRKAN